MMPRVARIASMVGVLITIGVLAWSTTYFVVYLSRWEWNRAIVSGIVALGLLVVLATLVVLRRLAALDRRLDLELHRLARAPTPTLRADASSTSSISSISSTSSTSSTSSGATRFAWLRPAEDPGSDAGRDTGRDAGVFIPVLLGTGVILSAAAYAIERIAGLVSGTRLDRRTALLVPLDLPLSAHARVRAHDLAAFVEPTDDAATADPSSRHRRRWAALLVVLALAAGGVESIRRLTQTSTGAIHQPGTTTMVVRVDTKRSRTPLAAVESMWALCRPRIDEPNLLAADADPADPAIVTMEIDRALGATSERRLIGCFEDVVLDYARLDVVSVDPHPAAAG